MIRCTSLSQTNEDITKSTISTSPCWCRTVHLILYGLMVGVITIKQSITKEMLLSSFLTLFWYQLYINTHTSYACLMYFLLFLLLCLQVLGLKFQKAVCCSMCLWSPLMYRQLCAKRASVVTNQAYGYFRWHARLHLCYVLVVKPYFTFFVELSYLWRFFQLYYFMVCRNNDKSSLMLIFTICDIYLTIWWYLIILDLIFVKYNIQLLMIRFSYRIWNQL